MNRRPLFVAILSSAGAGILALAYLFYALRYGPPAGDNPWGVTGLQWQTRSPPPKHNFDAVPVVDGPPYDYHVEMKGDEDG